MKTLSLFISIMILSISSFADAVIKGSVSDPSSNAIANAKVHLLQHKKELAVKKTDAKGNFRFEKLSPGSYQLYAEANGYEKSIFQAVVLGPDSERSLHFTLRVSVKDIEKKLVLEQTKTEVDNCEEMAPVMYDSRISNRHLVSGSGAAHSTNAVDGSGYIQHNTEEYDFIAENRFKEVTDDPLSTFSIDVDRASYSNLRRFLNRNQLPPKDAVRIEEMINYFNYDYPQPTDGHPFSVNKELGTCPWNEEHDLLLVGLKGEEMATEEVPASNIVFLLDVSGSMSSHNKLPLLKKAFHILIDKLRPKDRVAIVVYAGSAGMVLESTPGNKKAKIRGALDRLNAGGSTAGGAGIKLAYKIAKQNYIPGGNNRVILATDGDFNVGASSDAAMERLIEEKRNDGVFLTILGFGMGNYKDAKMEKLSNKGNGNYAYIDNIMEAKKMFSEEIWGTLYTIAKDVKIQIEFNPAEVKAYRLIGYENRMLNKEDFNDDKKDAGEIGAGHCVTALYEIIPAGSDETVSNVDDLIYQKRKPAKSGDLLTLKLRYKAPDEDKSKLLMEAIKASDIRLKAHSDNFKMAASVAMFGMLLRDSEFKGSANYEKSLRLAKEARGEDTFNYRQAYIGMIENARLLASN